MDEGILISIRQYSARLRRDPHLKIYAPLAECYRRANLLDDAEQTCKNGLDIIPGYLHCREVLGKVLLQRGKLESAREHLEKVASVVTESVELSRTLGKLYSKLGLVDTAKSHLEFVISKDPFDIEVRNLLAGIGPEQMSEEVETAEDTVDIFAEKPDKKIYDIKKIVAQGDPAKTEGAGAPFRASDELFDSLDSMEEAFLDRAELMAEGSDKEKTDPPRRPARIRRTAADQDNASELQEAAAVAQLYMELSLLDEALIASRRLLEKDPDDPDLLTLHRKFEKNLEQKEAELEKLEGSDLA